MARIAVAVQRDAQGRILVRRRSENAREFPGAWETPGGKMKPGESWAEAVEREFEEETGLDPWHIKTGGIVGAWRRNGVHVVAFEVIAPVPPGFVPYEPGMGPLVPSLEWLLQKEVANACYSTR